jgi:ADP-ribose pyrophosphatase YjhB (NUDIX family)
MVGIPGALSIMVRALKVRSKESREETSLDVRLIPVMRYSVPERPCHQYISVVFIADAEGMPVAADDALSARIFTAETLPEAMAFDHRRICMDYFRFMNHTEKPSTVKQPE